MPTRCQIVRETWVWDSRPPLRRGQSSAKEVLICLLAWCTFKLRRWTGPAAASPRVICRASWTPTSPGNDALGACASLFNRRRWRNIFLVPLLSPLIPETSSLTARSLEKGRTAFRRAGSPLEPLGPCWSFLALKEFYSAVDTLGLVAAACSGAADMFAKGSSTTRCRLRSITPPLLKTAATTRWHGGVIRTRIPASMLA